MSLKMEQDSTPVDHNLSSGLAYDPEKGSHDFGVENVGVPDGGRRAWSVLAGMWVLRGMHRFGRLKYPKLVNAVLYLRVCFFSSNGLIYLEPTIDIAFQISQCLRRI